MRSAPCSMLFQPLALSLCSL